MRTWKHWSFVAVFSLIGGVFYVNSLDIVVLKDGNMIEAKVMEISPSEIRYKRFDHLEGPTIVIPANTVLSIKYENGRVEIINDAPSEKIISTVPSDVRKTTAIDPNKSRFGINVNAGGALDYLSSGFLGGLFSGVGINIEIGKEYFDTEINLMFPIGGFGALFTFNGFAPSRIGGFYSGLGIGFSIFETGTFSIPLGLNIGYKFITKSGLYFRTGVFAGFQPGNRGGNPVYIKPDLSIGWTGNQ